MTTQEIIESLRELVAMPDYVPVREMRAAADRLETLQRNLKEAIELAEAAAKGSPYPQTPHFWKRIYDLRNGTNNSN